jgi:hypothetical protein
MEASVNVAIGFGLSYGVLYLLPLLAHMPLWLANLIITIAMTALSFARQYAVRRSFDRLHSHSHVTTNLSSDPPLDLRFVPGLGWFRYERCRDRSAGPLARVAKIKRLLNKISTQ